MKPEDVVRAELEAMSSLDIDQIMAHAPKTFLPGFGHPTYSGLEEIRHVIEGFLKVMTQCDIDIVNLAVTGNVVLTERVDRLIYNGKPEVLDERRGDCLAALVVTAVGAIATEVEHAVVGHVSQRPVEISLGERLVGVADDGDVGMLGHVRTPSPVDHPADHVTTLGADSVRRSSFCPSECASRKTRPRLTPSLMRSRKDRAHGPGGLRRGVMGHLDGSFWR